MEPDQLPLFNEDSFLQRFPDEEACRDYLYQIRWPNGFICPRCGNSGSPWNAIKHFICPKCGYKASVTARTFFSRSRLPLKKLFYVLWLFSSTDGMSAKKMAIKLSHRSYEVGWVWLNKIRNMLSTDQKILNEHIHLDEALVQRKIWTDKNELKPIKKAFVLILSQRRRRENKPAHFIYLKSINYPHDDIIADIIKDVTDPDCTIHATSYYKNMIETNANRRFFTVNGYRSIGYTLIPGCRDIAQELRRWIHVNFMSCYSSQHFQNYLDEFAFRYNNMEISKKGLLFYKLLSLAVTTPALPYNSIIKNVRKKH
jgi:hypothetical protein